MEKQTHVGFSSLVANAINPDISDSKGHFKFVLDNRDFYYVIARAAVALELWNMKAYKPFVVFKCKDKSRFVFYVSEVKQFDNIPAAVQSFIDKIGIFEEKLLTDMAKLYDLECRYKNYFSQSELNKKFQEFIKSAREVDLTSVPDYIKEDIVYAPDGFPMKVESIKNYRIRTGVDLRRAILKYEVVTE